MGVSRAGGAAGEVRRAPGTVSESVVLGKMLLWYAGEKSGASSGAIGRWR